MFKTKDTRIKSNFWDVAPMICCKMVWTRGVDGILCCLHSQRRHTGKSVVAYIQTEDWQQRRGEQGQSWKRWAFLGWQAFWQWQLREEKDGGGKTFNCTESPGDSSAKWADRTERRDEVRDDTGCGLRDCGPFDGCGWGMEEMWVGQPRWLQATRWFGGNTCCSTQRGEQQQRRPFHLLRVAGERL